MDYFKQKSKRLLFRKLTESDIPTWKVFFDQNPRIDFLGIDVSKSNEELAKEWIFAQFKRYTEQQFGHLAAVEKSSGDFIGMGGILPRIINNQQEYEIGYSLLPKFWRKGYATEIAQQLKLFAIQKQLNTKRLISIIHVENTASANVAQKNGMTILETTTYNNMPVNIYSITL